MPAERKTGVPKPSGRPGSFGISKKPAIEITPGVPSSGEDAPGQGASGGPSAGNTPGQGAYQVPGQGGLPGGSGPSAGDVKAPPIESKDLEIGHTVRDNLEKAIFGTPAVPGAYWEVQAADYEAVVAKLQDELKTSENLAYSMDVNLIEYHNAVAVKGSKAFEKMTTYANALLTWKENSSDALASAEYRQSFKNPHAVEDTKKNLVRYYLDSPAFVKVWSTAGGQSFPNADEAVQTTYPTGKDGFTFQDFPLLLDNKDKVVDGKVVPSVLRAMHEQNSDFLKWIYDCLVRLVQYAEYPIGVSTGYWKKDGQAIKKYDGQAFTWKKAPPEYAHGFNSGLGAQMWFLAGPTAKHMGPSWLTGGKGFSYKGWWLDQEIADYVAALVAFKIAMQNRASAQALDHMAIEAEIKVRQAEIAKYKKKAQEERDNVPKDLGAFLKQKLQKDGKTGDPELAAAAQKYVDICLDLRSIYDNKEAAEASIAASKNQFNKTYINFTNIEDALTKAQWIADNKLSKATNDAEKKIAFEELWTFLTVAKDSGVEKCVEVAKLDYQEYVDKAKAWKPDPKVMKYASFVFPEDLVAAGIDTWGPMALATPIPIVKGLAKQVTVQEDYSTAISRAVKDLDQYNKLLKMLPGGYVPAWQGDKPVPATDVDATQVFTPGITLSMTSVKAKPGDLVQLSISQIDDKGKVTVPTKVAWTSSNPTVVDISDTGVITANAVGNATVTAKVDNLEAIANVTVAAPVVETTTGGPNWLLIGGAAAAAFLLVSMLGGKSKD